MKLQPFEADMDFHHLLSATAEDEQEKRDQPEVGSFIEVRVREHPARWIRGEHIDGVVVEGLLISCVY